MMNLSIGLIEALFMPNLVAAIDPTRESLIRFVAEVPSGQPVMMLNLLRFREQADYGVEYLGASCSGREAYAEYSRQVLPLLQGVGGQPVWLGQAHCAVIAPAGEDWHEVLLVKYPHKEAFLQMIQSAAYRAIVHHRTAALADSRLLATTEASAG
jgi:uncharacterized protein (DUF1330 family)